MEEQPQNQPSQPVDQSNQPMNYDGFVPNKKKPIYKKPIFFVLLVIVLATAGYFGYKSTSKKTTSSQETVPSSSQTSSVSQTKTISTQTKNYSSQNFTLSFSYPQDWTVTDTTGTNLLTVTSPAVTLTDASNQKFNGQITMSIRGKTQKLTEFDKGSATAALESEKIAYTQPTQTQRGNTYVSFLRFAKTVNTAALDGVYITGDAGYKKDQDIPLIDITKVDPVISITFGKCSDATCSSAPQTSISVSSWSDTALSTPLMNMLKSLAID